MDKNLFREQFTSQGYCIIRGCLSEEITSSVRQALSRLVDQMAEQLRKDGVISNLYESEPFETRFYRLFQDRPEIAPKLFRTELHMEELYRLFFHPDLLDFAESVFGGEIRLYPNYTARPKCPDTEAHRVLWHQDAGYTDGGKAVEDLRMVNVWTPLVRATKENGCMQFIPGTHRLGVVRHVEKEHYLEVAEEVLKPMMDQARDIELDVGDVVLFHNLLLHQGGRNRSTGIRWSLDWRYQDATQSTLRREQGHLARSRRHSNDVVQGPSQWATLTFS